MKYAESLPRHHGDRLRVLPGDLHRHRAAVLGRGLRGGLRRVAARRRPRDHPQPAGDRRDGHAERLRRPDRVVLPAAHPAREHHDLAAPAQRPGYGGRGDRAGDDGRRRPGRGLPVRARRAHRQRRPGDAGDEPVQPGHRPARSTSPTSTRSGARWSTAPSCRCTRGTPTPATWSTRRSAAPTRTPSRRASRRSRRPPPRPAPPVSRAAVGGAVPADRPARRRPHLRGRHPGEQPVRQGRRGLHPQVRAQARPAAPAADRVQPGGPAAHRRRGRRDVAGRHLGGVPRRSTSTATPRCGSTRCTRRRRRARRTRSRSTCTSTASCAR